MNEWMNEWMKFLQMSQYVDEMWAATEEKLQNSFLSGRAHHCMRYYKVIQHTLAGR
jgi:predicted PP-loop superfamily ATPase